MRSPTVQIMEASEVSARELIRVMLVDDDYIFRKGLQRVLKHSDDFTVVGQTGEVEQAWTWPIGSGPM